MKHPLNPSLPVPVIEPTMTPRARAVSRDGEERKAIVADTPSKAVRVWSFVNESGEFTGRRFSGPPHALAANTPPGCSAIEGHLPRVERPEADDLRRDRVQRQIETLERRQARPVREFAIDPTNSDARRRVNEIEAQIAAAREELK